jgi:hypothetical protein
MEPTTRQGIGGGLSAIHDSAGTTTYSSPTSTATS